jgi:hypothetical protein
MGKVHWIKNRNVENRLVILKRKDEERRDWKKMTEKGKFKRRRTRGTEWKERRKAGTGGKEMRKEGTVRMERKKEGTGGKEKRKEGSVVIERRKEGTVGKKRRKEGTEGEKRRKEVTEGKKRRKEGTARKKRRKEGTVGKKRRMAGRGCSWAAGDWVVGRGHGCWLQTPPVTTGIVYTVGNLRITIILHEWSVFGDWCGFLGVGVLGHCWLLHATASSKLFPEVSWDEEITLFLDFYLRAVPSLSSCREHGVNDLQNS